MTTQPAENSANRFKKWLPVFLVVGLLALGILFGVHKQISLSNLIQHRETIAGFISENFIAAILIYLIIYIVAVAISFPGASALSVTSGLVFGGLLGGFLTVIGATIGAVIIFLIARSSFGEVLKQRAGPFLNKMIEGFQKDAFQYLLTIRLTPLFPFWAVNIAPALFNMKLSSYALATFIGIIPGTMVYTYIGAGLDSIIAAQEAANPGCASAGTCEINIKALITKEMIFALAGLAALSFLPFVLRKFKTASPSHSNAEK